MGNNGTGATVINLGGAGDTVNISGTLNNVTTTNTQVMDKTLVLNSGGTAATAGTAGIYFEEAADSSNSYVRVSSDRSKMELKAPTGSLIGLYQSLLTTDNVTFGTVTSTGINLSGNVTYGGSKFLSSNIASNLTVGRSAGNAITSASGITAIGNGALSAVTTSASDTAVGYNSLNQIVTGFGGNTAMGFNSGINLLADSVQNTMIGFESASVGSAAYSFCTAVGSQALKRCTANGNSAFGCGALLYTTSGVENVGVGTNAGSKLTTGLNNTFIGSNAGDTNLSVTTGSNNTLIGALTETASTAQTNATAIGYGAKVDADNCIQLGNTSVTAVKTSGTITAATPTDNAHLTTKAYVDGKFATEQYQTWSTTFNGPTGLTSSMDFRVCRVGHIVTITNLMSQSASATVATNYSSVSKLPAEYRPSTSASCVISVCNGSTTREPGFVDVNLDGSITMRPLNGTFSGAGHTTWTSWTMSYVVA